MTHEEIVVLNRIIYPWHIQGNTLSQYEAFEKVKQHLNTSHFKTVHARTVWQRLEQLYKDKMPFDDRDFEFGCLGDVWATSGVKDISKHIELLKGTCE